MLLLPLGRKPAGFHLFGWAGSLMGADQSVGATACLRARLLLAGPSALPLRPVVLEAGQATAHRTRLRGESRSRRSTVSPLSLWRLDSC